ncbi:MAG: hypothetical protein AAF557_17870 [Pseudomonadota bacterium]
MRASSFAAILVGLVLATAWPLATLGQQYSAAQGQARPLDRLWVLWERNTGAQKTEFHSLYVQNMVTEDALTVAESLGAESLAAAERAAGQSAPWRVPPVIVQQKDPNTIPRQDAQKMLARAVGHVQAARQQAAEAELIAQHSQQQVQLLAAAVQLLQEKLATAEEAAAEQSTANPLKELQEIYFTTENIPTPDLPPGVLEADFKQDLKSGIAARLKDAGLKLLTADEWKANQKRPTLSIALTPGNLRIRCPIPFEVAVRVTINEVPEFGKETTRSVMIWNKSGGPTDEFPDQELEAILSLVDAFVVDLKTAREEPLQPVEETPVAADDSLESLLEQALERGPIAVGPVPVNVLGENGDEDEIIAPDKQGGAADPAASSETATPKTPEANNQSLIDHAVQAIIAKPKVPDDAADAASSGVTVRQ